MPQVFKGGDTSSSSSSDDEGGKRKAQRRATMTKEQRRERQLRRMQRPGYQPKKSHHIGMMEKLKEKVTGHATASDFI
ncbi:hypothetical protein JKP88DRAFT_349061 [Tribonema minus]|uniref:Uncharacterized protein n=1 Tax=Tribonema minus TaxID=303371 RepID=A0A835YXN7_9STRA|nr:hypothetical protein JKP88DRAFT_349061 [Tribonema minus]